MRKHAWHQTQIVPNVVLPGYLAKAELLVKAVRVDRLTRKGGGLSG